MEKMKIDFNHPSILQGYLEQAKPQFALENVRGIVVGKTGGLAYRLFADDGKELPTSFNVRSIDSMKKVMSYLESIKAFIGESESYANNLGFRLVYINPPSNSISNGLESQSNIYFSGIGDKTIESVERFEKFLEMVKDYSKINRERNGNLISIAGSLQESSPLDLVEPLELNLDLPTKK